MTHVGFSNSTPGTVQRQRNVPVLAFPHVIETSPHYFSIKPLLHDWFISTRVIPDHRLSHFLGADHALFTAMMHPASSKDRLEKLARYYTLWFAMEEHAEYLWREHGAVQRAFSEQLAYLNTGRTTSTDPWILAYAQTLEDLDLTPALRERHRRWKTDWIEGEQNVSRYGNKPRPEFMQDRHRTVGMMLAYIVFAQYSLGVDLPSSIIEHPAVSALCTSLVHATSWQSDLLTLDAEDARNEYVNTVHVVSTSLGMTRQESIANIYRRYRSSVAQSFRNLATVIEMDWEVPPATVDSFCNAILSTTAGFLGWNQTTDRYVVDLQASWFAGSPTSQLLRASS
jgi:hypothetical protein